MRAHLRKALAAYFAPLALGLLTSLGLGMALLAPATANAAPIIYSLTTGSATVTADLGTTTVGAGVIALDGDHITFDTAPIAVVDLLFTATSQGPVMLGIPVAGYDTITIDTLSIGPGTGYSTIVGVGSNPYTVVVGPIDVVGTATISDSTLTNPTLTGMAFSFTNSSLSGSVTLSGTSDLTLTGLTLGTIDLGLPDMLTLKADISFTGIASTVPEPGIGALLAIAVCGGGVMLRRPTVRARR